jgi:hypothetical protein
VTLRQVHIGREQLEEAAGGYARDLAAGRPPDEAAELLALKLHPAWLEHQLSGWVLTPARFAEVCQAAFPGCRITDLYRARAVHYQATAPAG